ncbi:hypothetical protein CXF68_09475 [Tenacibaculum sp. Bg11-29]|uniref:right-handed parallel beta-helix repeat-containing protein n=1 Tax=Tenacibaculum sp. Bg11-29 TaxID=2058306 RepID=UPI000C34CBC7|nr:right-handed parallel beta-helix repeat-containing protein [Tenacibaculum sp. Bg11-29]PKH50903.1 hypothetical protein CXF68_09475 [Tenacibaculum sp. Bg11-29]
MNFKYLALLSYFILSISCKKNKSNIEHKVKETIVQGAPKPNEATKKRIDTLYYNENWDTTTKDKASFFRPLNFLKKDDLWIIRDYYITGELQYEAYSKNKIEKIWEGDAIWFEKNGAISQQTRYFRGIEITGDNKNEIEQEKMYETYDIEKIAGEVLKSKETGYILNDTIPDNLFLFNDDYTDVIPNKRLIIQLNSEEGLYYQNEFTFNKDNYLDKAYFENNQLILKFKDERRLTNWKRTLHFKLQELDSIESMDYDEYYEPEFILQEDKSFAEYPILNKKDYSKRNTSHFGDSIYLRSLKFKDTTNNYTWSSLQKTTNYQDTLYNDNDVEDIKIYSFLDSIKDNKTIHIKKGVYNFSKISYHKFEASDKEITVDYGELSIKGYSNIKFIAEKGVYFVSNDTHSDVVDFTNCNNIEINNIHAVHNVKETFCEAPVYGIWNSNNITFNNCIIDGSGKYGFYINNNSNSIRILNSTITNCSRSALYVSKSNIFMDNVKIINNDFEGCIINLNDSSLELENCLIEKNTVKAYYSFDFRDSNCKISNSTINIDLDSNNEYIFNISSNKNNTLVEHSTIKIKNKEKLSKEKSPKLRFIDCTFKEM